MREVRLLDAPFAPESEIARFAAAHPDAGGIVSFLGQVRAEKSGESGAVAALELRHYGPLTEPGMRDLADRAMARWPLSGVLVLHRAGMMAPGDPIVLVATAARHRRDGFAAADFLMDHLKSRAWFWKRERTADGWRWIEPRSEDYADLARWNAD